MVAVAWAADRVPGARSRRRRSTGQVRAAARDPDAAQLSGDAAAAAGEVPPRGRAARSCLPQPLAPPNCVPAARFLPARRTPVRRPAGAPRSTAALPGLSEVRGASRPLGGRDPTERPGPLVLLVAFLRGPLWRGGALALGSPQPMRTPPGLSDPQLPFYVEAHFRGGDPGLLGYGRVFKSQRFHRPALGPWAQVS